MTNTSKINYDRPIFTVICDYGKAGIETATLEGSETREALVRHIADGQLGDVQIQTILESNPVENCCRIITDDILQECADYCIENYGLDASHDIAEIQDLIQHDLQYSPEGKDLAFAANHSQSYLIGGPRNG